MSNYKIEYEKCMKAWVVWEVISSSFLKQVFSDKLKKNCKKWVDKRK